jgi:hypothetical protein
MYSPYVVEMEKGPFWEGSFERDKHDYVLRVPLADPSGDIARQVLSTMVEVPDEGSSGGGSGDTAANRDKQEEGPAPGYNLIRTPDGGLSVEVPQSWGVETGEDTEKEAGPNTWSYMAGEYLTSSITTAPNLDAWYHTSTSSGAYLVASKALAQDYTDYELTHSLMNAEKSERCTAGPYKDINRASYSGKIQTWYDCGVDGATTFSVVASPPGRGCVAVLGAKIPDEADRKAIEHLIDTFEVDCSHVGSKALAAPSSASPSAADSPEAGVSPSASAASSTALSSASAQGHPAGPAYNFIEVPRDTPPCPLGLDEVRTIYGPNGACGEGGGYVPTTGEESRVEHPHPTGEPAGRRTPLGSSVHAASTPRTSAMPSSRLVALTKLPQGSQ